MKHVHSTDDAELDRDPIGGLAEEKLDPPRSRHTETHARQAALNKTQTTTTQRNSLPTRGPSHGAPTSAHGVYTA